MAALPTSNFFLPLSDLDQMDVTNQESTQRTRSRAPSQHAIPSSQRVLKVMVWNACGLRRKVNEHLKSVIADVDIFAVCETLCDEVNLTRLDGYHHHGISTEKRVLGGSMPSRGVSIYWRTDLQIRVTPVQHNVQDGDVVWICLQPRQTTSVYIGCFYAPQHHDVNAVEAYLRLEQQVNSLQERGEVVLMGDFNARTGRVDRNHDPEVNGNGPRLCEMVERRHLEFLDLPLGTSPYTRIQNDHRSVIDYILVSRSLALSERTRRVVVEDCMGSDHNVLCATMLTR